MPATHLSRHVRDAHCLPALKGTSREAVMVEISQAFVDSGALQEAGREVLLRSVMQREVRGTTGIGNGVALPHPTLPEDLRGHLSDVLVGVGISTRGVDFQAVDGGPVHAVFLVAAPDPQEYLGVARLVAGLARDRRWPKVLKQCKSAREIRELIEEAWEGLKG